jgi:3-hydroxymyristoyl/3-hydroxydecanoyl-(acyl carrier protein) dehydratase
MKASVWKFKARALVDDELAVEADLLMAIRKLA